MSQNNPYRINTSDAVVWSIAGSDSAAAAGVQADLLSIHNFGVRGCTVVTTVTAQNDNTVDASYALSVQQVATQIDSLAQIHKPAAIKLGLVGSSAVAYFLRERLGEFDVPLIFDPVYRSGGDKILLADDDIQCLRDLLPLCYVLTPNTMEAAAITGQTINNAEDMRKAACALCDMGCASVLLTGGHIDLEKNYCWDYWTDGMDEFWLRHPLISGSYHGTGCALSSAIAAGLVNDWSSALTPQLILKDALVMATAYVHNGIVAAHNSGRGSFSHAQPSISINDMPLVYTSFGAKQTTTVARWGKPMMGIYPIIDNCAYLEKLRGSTVNTVQLRIKDSNLSEYDLEQSIATTAQCATDQGIRLIINDYWRLALKYNCYGVHLGQSDLADADLQAIGDAGLRLGISSHGWWELSSALAHRPSYIACGPIYATTSKIMPFNPLGLERLGLWIDILRGHTPLVAIGGIDEHNIGAIWESGVDGVAMINALTKHEDWSHILSLMQKP